MNAASIALILIGLAAVIAGMFGTGIDSFAACAAGACLAGYIIGTDLP